MHVALSGAAGFIGSHVLTDLWEHGHDGTALVHNDDQAQVVVAGAPAAVLVEEFRDGSYRTVAAG